MKILHITCINIMSCMKPRVYTRTTQQVQKLILTRDMHVCVCMHVCMYGMYATIPKLES